MRYQRLLNKIKKHASLGVMVAGAAGILLSTIILKQIMSPLNFGTFTLLATYVAVAFSFGMLGGEQCLLRAAHLEEGRIEISSSVLLTLSLTFLVGLMALPTVFYFAVSKEIPFSFLLIITACCQILLLLHSQLRLKSFFFEAQVMSSSWKIMLPIGAVAAYLLGTANDLTVVFVVVSVGLLAPLPYGIALYLKEPVVIKSGSSANYLAAYALSLGVLTVLTNIDRFAVEHLYGTAELGEYFYSFTVLVSPFVLLSGYIGFRELAGFKAGVNVRELQAALLKIVGLSAVICLAYVGALYAIDAYRLLDFPFVHDAELLAFLCFMAVSRMPYGLLSAAVGAAGSLKKIHISNAMVAFALIGACVYIYTCQVNRQSLLFLLAGIWALRVAMFYVVATTGKGVGDANTI